MTPLIEDKSNCCVERKPAVRELTVAVLKVETI
jgi:hypothetical protein